MCTQWVDCFSFLPYNSWGLESESNIHDNSSINNWVTPSELRAHALISMRPPLGGVASAGHVPAVPAVVPPWVYPGVQGQLPGLERRLQPKHDGERLLRWGRRVLPGAWRHSHRGAARRRCWRRDYGDDQEWQRQGQQLGLLSRYHLRPLS